MTEDFGNLSVEEIKQGWQYHPAGGLYTCTACGAAFAEGEIYPFGARFFEASRAVEQHVAREHGSRFDWLLSSDSKYLTLTENQKTLLARLNEGLSDKETAQALGVAPATVRHQKFVFREKAKQARLYLALYELAGGGRAEEDALLPVHPTARMVDERYAVTQKERDKICAAHFESLEPPRLSSFPAKEKKKLVVLDVLAAQFQPGKTYTEQEVNGILSASWEDTATLRRYLIEYGFLDRSRDCRKYWRL